MTNCAFASVALAGPVVVRTTKAASSLTSVFASWCGPSGRRAIQASTQARMASLVAAMFVSAAESPARQAFSRSLASFLYCSRLGRAGSGRASCGLGNIRISFQGVPGVRTDQAERRSVPSIFALSGWALPFPRTGCAPRAQVRVLLEELGVKRGSASDRTSARKPAPGRE